MLYFYRALASVRSNGKSPVVEEHQNSLGPYRLSGILHDLDPSSTGKIRYKPQKGKGYSKSNATAEEMAAFLSGYFLANSRRTQVQHLRMTDKEERHVFEISTYETDDMIGEPVATGRIEYVIGKNNTRRIPSYYAFQRRQPRRPPTPARPQQKIKPWER